MHSCATCTCVVHTLSDNQACLRLTALAQECDVSNQHLLISYQWGAKSSVFKIKERLKAAGYRVCTDVENTGIYHC